jgi:hypothetical protein
MEENINGWSGSVHDIVIRGATVVDGTGRTAFTGDVAILGEQRRAKKDCL